jgi:hypothetical protein
MGKRATKKDDRIVIDESKNLVFATEDELYEHFVDEITYLENEFFGLRGQDDISDDKFEEFEENLTALLDQPDEIWKDTQTMPDKLFHVYVKKFQSKKEDELPVYHVAVVYLSGQTPSFVYLHFPTYSEGLVTKYRRGEQIFDKKRYHHKLGAIEGDALNEGDEFAKGLFEAMLKVRSETDVKENDFKDFAHLREETIEQPDEIWRNNDSMGNVLVSFIKEFTNEESAGVFYIVVTLEDGASGSHALLFSFPSTDENLVGRYRHGENLQAEEVVQEASH